MPCYSPITGYKSSLVSVTGKRPIVFNRGKGLADLPVTLPCGKCIGCRIAKSRSWALRCVHESKQHARNCFLTLTYDDENLPAFGSLLKYDIQNFFKRVRAFGVKFRYYACGEYGESTKRPHYHVLMFGYDFSDDRRQHSKNERGTLYVSDTLNRLWPFGRAVIGQFSYQSAAYVARYVMKKNYGKNAFESSDYTRVSPITGEIVQVVPEFALMSRRPGIGSAWYDKFSADAFPSDFLVHQGKKHPVPKFYFDRLKQNSPEKAQAIKLRRIITAKKSISDSTPERLTVREAVKLSKIKRLQRNL